RGAGGTDDRRGVAEERQARAPERPHQAARGRRPQGGAHGEGGRRERGRAQGRRSGRRQGGNPEPEGAGREMIEKLRTIFQVPELRRRILFTLSLFVVYRLGEHMPTPGVNAAALAGAFRAQANGLFGLYDLFVGGAFSRATVFALGIMPYISASIILQLLGAVVPYFEKLRKEGEEG